MTNSWSGSNRRAQLPAGWSRIRARILKRDPICRCRGCNNHDGAICHRVSTECDHVVAGNNHADSNLQGLCTPCHKAKSAAEGVAARPSRKRPAKPHPGLKRTSRTPQDKGGDTPSRPPTG